MVLRALTGSAALLLVSCTTTTRHDALPVAITPPSIVEPTETPTDAATRSRDPRWEEEVREERALAFPSVTCSESEIGVGFLAIEQNSDPEVGLAQDLGCRRAGSVIGVYCCPDSLSPPPVVPHTGGGQSCEERVFAYTETVDLKGERNRDAGPPEPTSGQYGAVLNRGNYFAHCGVPNDTAIAICAAVRGGRAEGVTVRTKPPDSMRAECVAESVRGLTFPSGEKLDVTRTLFQ